MVDGKSALLEGSKYSGGEKNYDGDAANEFASSAAGSLCAVNGTEHCVPGGVSGFELCLGMGSWLCHTLCW